LDIKKPSQIERVFKLDNANDELEIIE